MIDAKTPCPPDHPMMKAWTAYKETGEYKNTKHWAMRVTPMIQASDPAADRRTYELMPLDQRERHVEGSLWMAFTKGWEAAQAVTADQREGG